MNDLSSTYLCTSHPAAGTYSIVPSSTPGIQAEHRMKGRNTRLQNSVLRNNTGNTALPRNDFFLKAS